MKSVASWIVPCLLLTAAPALAGAEELLTLEEETALEAASAPQCPPGRMARTPEQVWADRLAALAVGDMDRVMCDYARNARAVLPGSVLQGRDQIRAGFLAFGSLFGGTPPTLTSTTFGGQVLLVTFTLITDGLSIPDGADTFVIRNGLIRYHVIHATIGGAPAP